MKARANAVIDRLEAGLVSALMKLPPRVQLLLSGKRAVCIDGETLHPEMQLLLALRALTGADSLSSACGSVEKSRARLLRDARVHVGVAPPVASVRELNVAGPACTLKARHYIPERGQGAPLLLFLHGGGFVVCDLDTHDAACRILCREAGMHVLSVDYRLAPEHRFPAAVEDARAAFRFARDNAQALGADPERVCIGGDSAGGNLAAVVTQLAVQGGETAPYRQLLIYPAVDRTHQRPSAKLFARGFFLTQRDIEWFNGHTLGADGDFTHPWVSPLLCENLAGLPPALVITAAFDPLRDEGEAYAEALRAAGTHAVTLRVPGMVHGFINMVGASQAARDETVRMARAFRELLTSDAPAATAKSEARASDARVGP